MPQKKTRGKEDTFEEDTSVSSNNSSPKTKSKQKQNNEDKSQPTIDKHLYLFQPDNPETLNEILQKFSERLNKLASQEYIEIKFKQMITEEILSKKLKELENEVKSEIQKELESVRTEVAELSRKVKTMESIADTLRNNVSDVENDIFKLKEENSNLIKDNESMKEMLIERETQLKILNEKSNNLEQYTRRNSVRVYGITDKKNETPDETAIRVIKLAKDKLNISLQQTDIDVAHRMGRHNNDGNRPIICKFVRRYVKTEVMKVRRKLKGSAIVIREDLTHENAKLLENTSAHDKVQAAWSDEGKIVALLKNNKKIVVDRRTNLDTLPMIVESR